MADGPKKDRLTYINNPLGQGWFLPKRLRNEIYAKSLFKGLLKKNAKENKRTYRLAIFCKSPLIKWLRDWRLKISIISMAYRQTWILVVNWRWFVGKNSLKWGKFFWSRKLMFWGIVLGCFNNSNTKFWKVWTNGTHFMG